MSFRIILDESHDEYLTLANTEGMQLIFSKILYSGKTTTDKALHKICYE